MSKFDASWMPQRELLHHHPAQERTQQRSAFDAERVEQSDRVVRQVRGAERSTRIVAFADATVLEDQRRVVFRELRHLPSPRQDVRGGA